MTPHVADLVIAKFQTTPLFNGNISETFWKTSTDNVQRKYNYKYDDLNRLLKADYSKQGNTEFNSYLEHLTYDKNGNIQTLLRNGNMDTDGMQFANPIDELTYVYDNNNKNLLLSVSDATTNPQGFKDGINSGDDYTYDANGNMTRDDNKGIINITYNHLNLPTQITFENENKISYLYNAVGQKVRKNVDEIVNNQALYNDTYYLSGFQYKNNVLQFFPHAEGYVNATQNGTSYTFNYVYNYTDHLGNIRLSYSQDPSTNVLKVIEENHYYPFGLKHTGYNSDQMMYVKEEYIVKIKPRPVLFKTSYDKKFNGKSWETDLSLNVYDFHARGYMPDIVRTFQQDPLAEKFSNMSPYSFLNNNPMYFIDPTGMKVIEHENGTTYTGSDAQNVFAQLKSQMSSSNENNDEGDDWIKNNETGEVKWFDGTGQQAVDQANKHWNFFDSKGKTKNLGSAFFGTTGETIFDYSQIKDQQLSYLLLCSYKINKMSGVKLDTTFGNNLAFEYLKSAFFGVPFGKSSSGGSDVPGLIWDYGGADVVQNKMPKNIITKTFFKALDIYLSSESAGAGSDRASHVRADAVNYFKTTTINNITPATLFNISLHKF